MPHANAASRQLASRGERALLVAVSIDFRRRISRRGLAIVGPFVLLIAATALGVVVISWRETAKLFTTGAPHAALWATYREWLYYGYVAMSAVLSYTSLAFIFRSHSVRLLALLPIPGRVLFRVNLRELLIAHAPLPLIGIAAQIPLLVHAGPAQFAQGALLFALGFPVALVVALALHLAAGRAVSRGGSHDLSGGWVPAASAPFLYTPAIAVALTAVLGIPLQRSLEVLETTPHAALIGIAVLSVPIPIAFFYARRLFERHYSNILPVVLEADSVAARVIESSATHAHAALHVGAFGALLRGRARSAYAKDAIAWARSRTGDTILRFLASLALFVLALRNIAPLTDARVILASFLLIAYAARVSLVLYDAAYEPPHAASHLPRARFPLALGKYWFGLRLALTALLPLPAALAIGHKGQGIVALLPGLVAAAALLPAVGIVMSLTVDGRIAARAAYTAVVVCVASALALGVS